MLMPARMPKPVEIYQIKVTLRDSQPPIWRRFQVRSDITLAKLHRILQRDMGWEDAHLHQFVIRSQYYGIPDQDEVEPNKTRDEQKYKLSDVVPTEGSQFAYNYDFGDYWQHALVIEKTLPPQEGARYPVCLAGARACPPEDVGGLSGYADYLEAMADPGHEGHENMLQWRAPFDPESFSLAAVNRQLQKKFRSVQKTMAMPVSPQRNTATDRATDGASLVPSFLTASGTPPKDRKRIRPDEKVPLELDDRERELILKHSFASEELTDRLRIVPRPNEPPIYRFTLDDLDELAGYVAAEANHAKNKKLQKEWDRLYARIAAVLESYTDD